MDFEQEETTSFQSHQMSSKDWSQSIKQFTLVFKRQEMQLQCNMALSCFQHLLKMNKLLIQTCKMYRHKDLNLNMYSTSLFPFFYALHNNSFMWITTAILIICTGLFCSNEVISQLLGTSIITPNKILQNSVLYHSSFFLKTIQILPKPQEPLTV